jgi:hypothetical protein
MDVERMAGLPPGPELFQAVFAVDWSTLDGHGAVVVMQAANRLTSWGEATLMRSMQQVAQSVVVEPESNGGREADSSLEPDQLAVAEVAAALTWTTRHARQRLMMVDDLFDRMPQVWEAMDAGLIDSLKAYKFHAGLFCVQDRRIVQQIVDIVLPKAPRWTSTQIARKIQQLILRHDPDAARVRAYQAKKARSLYAQLDAETGTGELHVTGAAVDKVVKAMERVDAYARAFRNDGDERTLEQLRVDVLLDLAAGEIPGRGPIHRVGVLELTMDLPTAMGLADLPAELVGWGPIAADIARQMAAKLATEPGNAVRFTVHDGDGSVVASGTTRRRPPAAMARQVRARVDRCIHPGCLRPASGCDLDHQQRWEDGGPTEEENLHPLCRFHHRCKDEGGWRYEEITPQLYRWTSPMGHEYMVDRRRFGPDEEAA